MCPRSASVALITSFKQPSIGQTVPTLPYVLVKPSTWTCLSDMFAEGSGQPHRAGTATEELDATFASIIQMGVVIVGVLSVADCSGFGEQTLWMEPDALPERRQAGGPELPALFSDRAAGGADAFGAGAASSERGSVRHACRVSNSSSTRSQQQSFGSPDGTVLCRQQSQHAGQDPQSLAPADSTGSSSLQRVLSIAKVRPLSVWQALKQAGVSFVSLTGPAVRQCSQEIVQADAHLGCLQANAQDDSMLGRHSSGSAPIKAFQPPGGAHSEPASLAPSMSASPKASEDWLDSKERFMAVMQNFLPKGSSASGMPRHCTPCQHGQTPSCRTSIEASAAT